MKAPPNRFPELKALQAGLRAVLLLDGAADGCLSILGREPSIWASTYPSEIITCRTRDHSNLRLYCKYMAGPNDESYGHRGGLLYESQVYRHVLAGSCLPAPKFYGSYADAKTGDLWLVVEYLDSCLRVTKGPQPESLVAAAEWLGRFHAVNETRVSNPVLSFLRRYDSRYYLGWVRRTSLFARKLRSTPPWLAELCRRFEEWVEILLAPPATIIHGEYYPHNILWSRGAIYPIDWESAAVAADELDLAMLTEAWNPACVRRCEFAYQYSRWNGAPPDSFERRLAAARLYLCFRWLGDQPEWTLHQENRFYFDQMCAIGEQMGWL